MRKVRVFVERTFRGIKEPKPVNIESTSYKTDYKLIPKHEEHKYLNAETKHEPTLMPQFMEFPPLMREFLLRENPKLKAEELRLEMAYTKKVQIAKDGEKPSIEFEKTISTKFVPELYKYVKVQ